MSSTKMLNELVKDSKEYLSNLKKNGVTEVEVSGKKKQTKTLDVLCKRIKNCNKCELSKTRTKFVFGEGSQDAEIIFIGEAPGRDEDMQGRPFVGRAGKLLDKIINAMGFKREDVYICNILKCRPPNNRTPLPGEADKCKVHLKKQLSLLENRKVICALGLCAAQNLLKLDLPMYQLRGNWYDYEGTPVIVTYHPAYLLRNPSAKSKVWHDMKKVIPKCSQK